MKVGGSVSEFGSARGCTSRFAVSYASDTLLDTKPWSLIPELAKVRESKSDELETQEAQV